MKAASQTRVPLDIGTIHFIGIGGIGMSGIAEIMHNLGYKVRGSDQSGKRQCEAPEEKPASRSSSAIAGQSRRCACGGSNT